MSETRIVDLYELRRKAKADALALDGLHGDPSKRGGWIGHRDYARSTVALIDRVNELQGALADALFWLKPGLADRSAEMERDRADLSSILHKGITLP